MAKLLKSRLAKSDKWSISAISSPGMAQVLDRGGSRIPFSASKKLSSACKRSGWSSKRIRPSHWPRPNGLHWAIRTSSKRCSIIIEVVVQALNLINQINCILARLRIWNWLTVHQKQNGTLIELRHLQGFDPRCFWPPDKILKTDASKQIHQV